MPKKKRATRTRKTKPKPTEKPTRPVYGFGYRAYDEDGTEAHIIIKHANCDHLIVDEFWGDEDM